HRTRIVAYAKAMEALAQKYPDDDEAQIHYALALNTSASPADKTYSNQLKGAAILEGIAVRQPLHPGVAHYLIHLYDYPAIADKGIEAARRYAKIAPDAPHALHPRGPQRNRETFPTNCMPWTISSTPICSSGKTTRPRLWSTRWARSPASA